MLNKSGLEPLGRAVLVRMIEVELAKNSPIVIPEHVRAQSAAMEQRAEVIAVGSECWRYEAQPRAKPGDRVILTKMAGYVAQGPADKEIYRLVNDRDVFCRITEEKPQ